jgi:hypothetical protein
MTSAAQGGQSQCVCAQAQAAGQAGRAAMRRPLWPCCRLIPAPPRRPGLSPAKEQVQLIVESARASESNRAGQRKYRLPFSASGRLTLVMFASDQAVKRNGAPTAASATSASHRHSPVFQTSSRHVTSSKQSLIGPLSTKLYGCPAGALLAAPVLCFWRCLFSCQDDPS